jgi:DNA-binding GntR family transcriptional regulator
MDSNDQDVTLAEQVYQRLHHEILTCILAPGQVVSERELARRYETSKTPIREALAQTCHEGLMQRLQGRGYMVSPITIKDIRDLFDLRLILEVTAAERATQNPQQALIDQLNAMSNISYKPDDLESHVAFLKTNRAFHLTLAQAAGNRRLLETLEELLNQMERLFHLGLRLRDSSQEMVREHREIVDALESRDAEKAREVITNQITRSRDRILEAVFKGELQPVHIN